MSFDFHPEDTIAGLNFVPDDGTLPVEICNLRANGEFTLDVETLRSTLADIPLDDPSASSARLILAAYEKGRADAS